MLDRPAAPPFGAASESIEMLLTKLRNQRWTRAPADRSLSGPTTHTVATRSRCLIGYPTQSTPGTRIALRRGLAPVGSAFDDALPASVRSAAGDSPYSVEPPGDTRCVTTSSRRFRPRRSLRIEPLTLPVAASQRVTNHALRKPPELSERALSSRARVGTARSAFHRRVFSQDSFEEGEPATAIAVLPLQSGFRRSFASPAAVHGETRPGAV